MSIARFYWRYTRKHNIISISRDVFFSINNLEKASITKLAEGVTILLIDFTFDIKNAVEVKSQNLEHCGFIHKKCTYLGMYAAQIADNNVRNQSIRIRPSACAHRNDLCTHTFE